MNIYIEVEVTQRELSGRLLIALELIKYGHQVYIADRGTINQLALKKKIQPGIIFLKDMNASALRISEYKKLIKNKFRLVSQDEECGTFKESSFKYFYRDRFQGSKSFKYIDKYFCWGELDYDFLKKINTKIKFCKTGSPRMDIAINKKLNKNTNFKKKNKLKDKVILISLNHNLFWKRDFIERLTIDTFELKKDSIDDRIKIAYENESNDYILFLYLFQLIVKLDELNNFSIVVRPHPAMDRKKCELVFNSYKYFKNLRITTDRYLIDQINYSNYIISTGCTSGVEATLSNKNVITFLPNKKNLKEYKKDIFLNTIGKKFDDASKIFKYIKKNSSSKFKQKKQIEEDKNRINKRALIDKISFKRIADEINSIKMKNFENSDEKFLYKHGYFSLIKKNIKKILIDKKLIKKDLNVFEMKFPPFEEKFITEELDNLKKSFNINCKYNLKILNDRCLKLYQDKD
jgi:surface carbohydrate biosynthesis protein